MQYEVVGYAPRSPRDWWSYPDSGRAQAELAAEQLMGGHPVFRGVRGAGTLSNDQQQVGVSVLGPVVLVVWSGFPATALRWDRLDVDPGCHRFQVTVFPASDGLDVSWAGPDGEILRQVQISGGRVVTDVGVARVVDEDAGTDTSLTANWEVRLPAAVRKRLLADAADGEVKVYDGRRYVRTDEPAVLGQARIVHTDRTGNTWVAVDQSGTINTLRDPLADLSAADPDPDELAEQVLQTWFRFSMAGGSLLPALHCYAWPEDPAVKGLAEAISIVQHDQQGFFSLLGGADYHNAEELLTDRYGLHDKDVSALLSEPLRNLLPLPPDGSQTP